MNRRQFLSRFGTAALAGGLSAPALAQSGGALFSASQLRGSRSAVDFGVIPGAIDDQSERFQAMLDAAAADLLPVFLPGGHYVLSNIRVPSRTVIQGVPGQTKLIYGGNGYLLHAEREDAITLDGIAFDGVNRWSADYAEGLIDFRSVENVTIADCTIRGAGRNAIYLEACSGRLRDNIISGAGQFAIFTRQSTGMAIAGNAIDACANGGIVVHRWDQGRDATLVTGNRISGTGAGNGGTGQWGNAINLFRTDDVIVANNIIEGSAFSAIRGNAARGLQIIGNNCRASGETAIYAEFAFENAVVANNIIDGAANGISVTNFDHGGRAATVSGNIVRNLTREGPYEPDFPGFGTGIGVEADTTVTGNTVEGAPLYGINAGWGPHLRDVVVSANTVRDCGVGIGVSAAEGAGRALVRQNIVSGREGGIIAHAWGQPVSGDLALKPRGAPSNILVEGNLAT
jgi:uncharacterized secreted repeat protein (TIGR03808 family)